MCLVSTQTEVTEENKKEWPGIFLTQAEQDDRPTITAEDHREARNQMGGNGELKKLDEAWAEELKRQQKLPWPASRT